jgi:hypothetical protein
MKKYLPFSFLVIILLAVVGFVLARGGSGNVSATLTPSEDNRWLKLEVGGISAKAESMKYELIYNLPDGRVQGVPGTVELKGGSIERDILLGTESSGTYYYDEGVEKGSLSLKFYSGGDKPIEEYESEWVLKELKSDPKVF